MQSGTDTKSASSQESPPNGDVLEAIEVELTKDVPSILETMNSSSTELNTLESEAATAEQKYQQSLADWTSLSERMRSKYGRTFDAVRPFFDAAHRARSASQRAQVIVRSFSASASQCSQANAELRKIEQGLSFGAHSVSLDWEQQENLSKATVRALKCQQERDRYERDYAKVLQEYEEAKAAAEKCRIDVGKVQIERMKPCFKQLKQSQLQVDERRKHMSALQERIRVAKNTYNQSMRSLDRISTAVHHARKEHSEKEAARKESAASEDCARSCPEQEHPVAETGEDSETGYLGDCDEAMENCAKVMDGLLVADGAQTPEVTGEDCPFT